MISIQNDTVEGATVLIEKIGFIFDELIEKAANSQKKTGPDGQPTLLQRNSLAFQDIFKRFEELKEDLSISQRIRILIINMLDSRKTGWVKAKQQNESGPKKVDELRRELEQKAYEEEQIRILAE